MVFVPYGDADALAAELDDTVAAVILEPIQGENGVVEPPTGYLEQVRELTLAADALLWIDEVQTGIGRCGDWLASAASGVTADIVTFAKGLGNGFPIGACVATGRGGVPARPRLARHHLRWQPGSGGGRARRDRDHRARRPAGACPVRG